MNTKLDGKSNTTHTHSYAATSHIHDDRYYTESEINTKLNGKSDTGHTHPGIQSKVVFLGYETADACDSDRTSAFPLQDLELYRSPVILLIHRSNTTSSSTGNTGRITLHMVTHRARADNVGALGGSQSAQFREIKGGTLAFWQSTENTVIGISISNTYISGNLLYVDTVKGSYTHIWAWQLLGS